MTDNMIFTEKERLLRLILKAYGLQILKKVVFSKSSDKEIIKCVLSPKLVSGKDALQAESFYTDNKARRLVYEEIGDKNC